MDAVEASDEADDEGDNDEDKEEVLSAGEVVRLFVITFGEWRVSGKEADDDDDDSGTDWSSASMEFERESRFMTAALLAAAAAAACFAHCAWIVKTQIEKQTNQYDKLEQHE